MHRQSNVCAIILSILCLSVVTFCETNKESSSDIIFKIEHVDTKALRVVREGEEIIETTQSSLDPPVVTNATDLDACLDGNDRGCCYQFTWPGPLYDNGGNFSCSAYESLYHSKEPCMPPVVLTNKPNGLRPNLTELELHCETNTCKIYCRKTSCIKYSYYQNTKSGQQLWNETKFCGSVLSDNNGVQIQNGCFKEKMDAYTREVCVCQGHLCNSSPTLSTFLSFALYSLILFLTSRIVS